MKTLKTALVSLCCAAPSLFAVTVLPPDNSNLVQIAILLDASNSMDGLISQAKSQLWNIVNEFATARRNGRAPVLQVALYEYGKDNLPASTGFIRQICGLTTDLDRISEALFSLTTNGGSEYCGQVIRQAYTDLDWDSRSATYKAIFIAGNEPFSQGTVNYTTACRQAIARGIIVNTIYCGDRQEGIRTGWKEGADLCDGSYFAIDHTREITYINTPYDRQITELNSRLNETYVGFGTAGFAAKERQKSQDRAAASVAPAVAVQRSVAKSSGNYRTESWDLVAATQADDAALEKVAKEELPAEMQAMDATQRKNYLAEKSRERTEIQSSIARLHKERQTYIDKEQKKSGEEQTLDAAILKAVRSQAARKNYTFESR